VLNSVDGGRGTYTATEHKLPLPVYKSNTKQMLRQVRITCKQLQVLDIWS